MALNGIYIESKAFLNAVVQAAFGLAALFAASKACAELVHWDFPLTNGCHEGLAFSDGITGVLVWGDVPGGEIMQMDGMCGAAASVLELMVHEVGGETCRFRGCPEEWETVSFENILLSDGTRASGQINL